MGGTGRPRAAGAPIASGSTGTITRAGSPAPRRGGEQAEHPGDRHEEAMANHRGPSRVTSTPRGLTASSRLPCPPRCRSRCSAAPDRRPPLPPISSPIPKPTAVVAATVRDTRRYACQTESPGHRLPRRDHRHSTRRTLQTPSAARATRAPQRSSSPSMQSPALPGLPRQFQRQSQPPTSESISPGPSRPRRCPTAAPHGIHRRPMTGRSGMFTSGIARRPSWSRSVRS